MNYHLANKNGFEVLVQLFMDFRGVLAISTNISLFWDTLRIYEHQTLLCTVIIKEIIDLSYKNHIAGWTSYIRG